MRDLAVRTLLSSYSASHDDRAARVAPIALQTVLTDRRGIALSRSFEAWMTGQMKKDVSWGQVARAMITATGDCKFDDDGKNGALFLMLSRQGPDAANERAAEVSRVFLGIQIQCAQCHDHPSDVWKRQQFHELAAFFPRVASR